ncbi:hypothetical protein [Limosilactobacillus secaliphilus]|nr:hypothetical protein [Limosilactobacillus secaliphilus]
MNLLLMTQSNLYNDLYQEINRQNTFYFWIIGIVLTISITIAGFFGILQWRLSDKQIKRMKEETKDEIANEYSLEKIEELDQYQQKAKILLKNMYSQWHGNLITNIFKLIQEIGNDPKTDVFFKMDDFKMNIDDFIDDPFLSKENTGVSLMAILTKLEKDEFKRPEQASEMAKYVRNKGKESLQAYYDMRDKTVEELKNVKY